MDVDVEVVAAAAAAAAAWRCAMMFRHGVQIKFGLNVCRVLELSCNIFGDFDVGGVEFDRCCFPIKPPCGEGCLG